VVLPKITGYVFTVNAINFILIFAKPHHIYLAVKIIIILSGVQSVLLIFYYCLCVFCIVKFGLSCLYLVLSHRRADSSSIGQITLYRCLILGMPSIIIVFSGNMLMCPDR